jgi:hypothetical protein
MSCRLQASVCLLSQDSRGIPVFAIETHDKRDDYPDLITPTADTNRILPVYYHWRL